MFHSSINPTTPPPSTPAMTVSPGASLAALSPATSSGPGAPLTAEILTLKDLRGQAVSAERIPAHIAVSGRVYPAPLPAGHELWLLVGFPNNGNWFPGNGDRLDPGTGPHMSLHVRPDGGWHNPDLTFGNDDQACGRFDLVLADVGKDGVQQLIRYYANEDPNGPPGIARAELVDDIKPLARMPVTRAPLPGKPCKN
jgi:hypothetical protein